MPSSRITQEEAAEVAKLVCCETDEQRALLPTLYRQTEIRTRHMVLSESAMHDVLRGKSESSTFIPRDGGRGPTTHQRMQRYIEEAGPLALRAAKAALEESRLDPATITHLITVTCTGFSAPGVDIQLIKGLGLPATTVRTHVGFMGCHAALNGLRVARGFTGSDPKARVLLCAVELCTLHHHYGWDPKRMVANALFADGAAAVVGVPPRGVAEEAWRVAATGSCLFPDSEYAMSWNIGDHGFAMTLSTKVPNLIGDNLKPWLESWLQQHNLSIDRIKSWAIHPGGPRIVNVVERALGIPEGSAAVSREVLSECGNMSSPTVLFILDRLRRRNAPRPCVALGFGPGLVAEGGLFV